MVTERIRVAVAHDSSSWCLPAKGGTMTVMAERASDQMSVDLFERIAEQPLLVGGIEVVRRDRDRDA